MKYDIAIIGGGPAGMMAAGRAGELGARVVLIEKNKKPGIKLLLTGKGRCNITNKTDEEREIIKKFGVNGKFLFSSLNKFGVDEVINFFESNGVKTKVERGDRVFPVSDRSQTVLDALIKYMEKNNVIIRTNADVQKVVKEKDRIEKIVLEDGEEIFADKFIICTGGKSYPNTGSMGDGYRWAKSLGHTVTKLSPALTPVILKEKFVKELEGLNLKNIEISVYKKEKKIDSRFGEAIFTARGMSGPIILEMSKNIGQNLPDISLKIDFKPALEFSKLKQRVERDFKEGNNKMFKNILSDLLPQKLIPVIIKLSEINPDKKVNLITKEEKNKLLHLLKEFKLEVSQLMGFIKAVVTSGGVKLSEVDPKTMQSKIIENLYFAGEVLDLDGPTGGYNLQSCWSTGFSAGEGAAK
ncbi:MAG: NAD(P)/FAD-dependent oxidoreductase [Parcubacteria group bacterium]|nr:NAD(P)/FAD-dependent oxidoreductase [Parcubacteria group bacterium]